MLHTSRSDPVMLRVLLVEGDQIFCDVVEILILDKRVHLLRLEDDGVTDKLGARLRAPVLLVLVRHVRVLVVVLVDEAVL